MKAAWHVDLFYRADHNYPARMTATFDAFDARDALATALARVGREHPGAVILSITAALTADWVTET